MNFFKTFKGAGLFVALCWLCSSDVHANSQGGFNHRRHDLKRGLAELREASKLFEEPSEDSKTLNTDLYVGKKYFVLGLSLDGAWVQILTSKNKKGWVLVSKVSRLENETDRSAYRNFVKRAERFHWYTNRLSAAAGAYFLGDYIGELTFSLFPSGLGGLKGESIDLVGGVVFVADQKNVENHMGYRAALQWPFRFLTNGNLFMGPRVGYELRNRFNPVGLEVSEQAGFVLVGLLFKYMPNDYLGIQFVPEFLVHPNETRFQAYTGLSLSF